MKYLLHRNDFTPGPPSNGSIDSRTALTLFIQPNRSTMDLHRTPGSGHIYAISLHRIGCPTRIPGSLKQHSIPPRMSAHTRLAFTESGGRRVGGLNMNGESVAVTSSRCRSRHLCVQGQQGNVTNAAVLAIIESGAVGLCVVYSKEGVCQ